MDRRQAIKGAMTGMLTLWASPWARAAQQASGAQGVRRLTDKLVVVDGGGTNVVAFSTGDGLLLVDTGVPNYGDKLVAALKGVATNSKVHTVFNTHYHLDQTGNNEVFAASGAKIIAQDRTRQWMANDYWIPEEGRYEKARPKAAWPTQLFFIKESMKAGGEQIDYGYLLEAHTGGDAYVYFKDSNVLAVGDVASPVKDPELDWITGAWIGARVDAMDLILKISNEQTKIVPGTGPVMTQAEFKAEREMMEIVRQRLFKQGRSGDGPKDMLEGGVLKGLTRTWKDPYKFLYGAVKGLWGNHNKLDPDVV
ncbi:MAG TPA: MBL fold metallo-hydrolase [Terriglobia bacterium]|nr:MBL fold metallo-hydrolase [Terriglobia bacterium]